jgi:hypothetical protein
MIGITGCSGDFCAGGKCGSCEPGSLSLFVSEEVKCK